MTAEELERNFFLVEDATGSSTARFASDLPDSLADATEMPAAVGACDLAMSVDVRERRSELDHLEDLEAHEAMEYRHRAWRQSADELMDTHRRAYDAGSYDDRRIAFNGSEP